MVCKGETHLQVHFNPVQRRCARPGNCSSYATRHQVSPPEARLHLFLCEVIRYIHILANVEVL